MILDAYRKPDSGRKIFKRHLAALQEDSTCRRAISCLETAHMRSRGRELLLSEGHGEAALVPFAASPECLAAWYLCQALDG